MLANDVQETPAKGCHLLDGSPFGYDAHKGETQRTHNPLVAGSIPAGPTAISAGHVLYSDSPGDSKGADRTPRVCSLSARPLCPPDSLPVCGAAPCAAPNQAVRQPVPSLLHTSIPLTSAGGLVFSLSAGATSRVGVPTIDDAVTGPALGLRALGKRERPPVVDVGHLPQHFDHHCSPS